MQMDYWSGMEKKPQKQNKMRLICNGLDIF